MDHSLDATLNDAPPVGRGPLPRLTRALPWLVGAMAGTLLVLCMAGQALSNRFAGDDYIWIYDASQVRGFADLFHIHDAPFAHYDGVRLNPTVNLFFLLGYALFGLRPAGYHAMALAMYVLSGLLMVAWLRALRVDRWSAGLAGIVFLLYPLHAEPVAWLSAVGEGIVGLCSLATLVAFWRWRQVGGALRWIVLLGSFLCALLAKESALPLPFVLLLGDALLAWPSFRLRRHVPFWALFILVTGWRWLMLRAVGAEVGAVSIAVGLRGFMSYTARYAMAAVAGPGAVGSLDAAWGTSETGWNVGFLALLALLLWSARGVRRGRPGLLAFHIGWLLLAVQPYVWLVAGHELYPRYTWQASLAVVSLFGVGLSWAATLGWTGRRLALAGTGLVVALSFLGMVFSREVGHFTTSDDSAAIRQQLVVALERLGPSGRVYSYIRSDHEHAAGRAISLFGNVPEARILDWYDVLQTRHLHPGDVMVFYDDVTREFVDLTDFGESLLREMGPEDLRRIWSGPGGPALSFNLHDPAQRAPWRTQGLERLGPYPLYRTGGRQGSLVGPDLKASPFSIYKVRVDYRPSRWDTPVPPVPVLGWSSDAEGGYGPERIVSGATWSRNGVFSALYYPGSRVAWWTQGRIRRLYVIPSQDEAIVEIHAIQAWGGRRW